MAAEATKPVTPSQFPNPSQYTHDTKGMAASAAMSPFHQTPDKRIGVRGLTGLQKPQIPENLSLPSILEHASLPEIAVVEYTVVQE